MSPSGTYLSTSGIIPSFSAIFPHCIDLFAFLYSICKYVVFYIQVFKNWRYIFIFITSSEFPISFLKCSYHRTNLSSVRLLFNYDDWVPFLPDMSLIKIQLYRYHIPRSACSNITTLFSILRH